MSKGVKAKPRHRMEVKVWLTNNCKSAVLRPATLRKRGLYTNAACSLLTDECWVCLAGRAGAADWQ